MQLRRPPLLPLMLPLLLPLLLVLLLVPPAIGHYSVLLGGDLVLGGLFPVHEKGDSTPCSTKLSGSGLQQLEAMLFAVDQINNDSDLLPNTSLGVHIVDTCGTAGHAVNQALALIKGPLDEDAAAFECSDGSLPRPKHRHKTVSGVVGGSSNIVSMNVADLLRVFRIPQISPASTAQYLSDRRRFDYFARTVPSDSSQVDTLVDMIRLFNWTYISTVASENAQDFGASEAFQARAAERNICIAVHETVPADASAERFEAIVLHLQRKQRARGVILFVTSKDARGLLKAAKRMGLQQQFHWIAAFAHSGDGWGSRRSVVRGAEEVAEGALAVELASRPLPAFDRYMAELTPDTNRRNPWFRDYWQAFFGCSLAPDAAEDTACDPALRLRPETGFVQEAKVQFVIDAVYAFANAFHALQRDLCGNQLGICEQMNNYDGGDFYQNYILNVSFTGLAGNQVKFDENGDGVARHTIFNYRWNSDTRQYEYKAVGRWQEGRLTLRTDSIRWNRGFYGRPPFAVHSPRPPADTAVPDGPPEPSRQVPLSVCSLPCGPGEVKSTQVGDVCCWICFKP
ncbi:metabotropic glutamate receptor-like [Amphibalanus amphitrite]|uniref:metabotropic glutamate receptor-like n=1 Tax=Amphibalanus amphitrite TaxID=1232801 RepID=UPI001C8FB1D1|nr:metabotropic glutamate receptor-like [Amphibalanus amphitrite]